MVLEMRWKYMLFIGICWKYKFLLEISLQQTNIKYSHFQHIKRLYIIVLYMLLVCWM